MKLYNSLTRSLNELRPSKPHEVSLYVCGITPYDTTHLGHSFTYLSFDVLVRYLKFKGFRVRYTQNVTDINDRDKDVLQKAKEWDISWKRLAYLWTKRFLTDMKALHWTKPTNFIYASKEIPGMVELIKKLLKKGLAYQINASIYLDITKFPHFGKLSKLNLAQMIKVAKDFEEDLDNPDKKHPLDVTLWRGAVANQASHIPAFASPFGEGRPGWHLECSAMATETLGETIDIHGGGSDLIFPHHEMEIIQSEGATGKAPFVKYWMHIGTVYYRGDKMSKSKGNLVLVSDLLKKYSPNAIRWLMLSHHYREPWEFFEKDLIKAQKNVDRVEKAIKKGSSNLEEFAKIMDNDLDTPKALKYLLKNPNQKVYEVLGFAKK